VGDGIPNNSNYDCWQIMQYRERPLSVSDAAAAPRPTRCRLLKRQIVRANEDSNEAAYESFGIAMTLSQAHTAEKEPGSLLFCANFVGESRRGRS